MSLSLNSAMILYTQIFFIKHKLALLTCEAKITDNMKMKFFFTLCFSQVQLNQLGVYLCIHQLINQLNLYLGYYRI
jgi:hypothetical protein